MTLSVQKFQVAGTMSQVCSAFSVDEHRVTRRAGLPSGFFELDGRAVSASEFYALWESLDVEKNAPDFPLQLAEGVIQHGFDSAVYSFYCSPTVRVGLERKALFKPLIAPLRMTLSDYDKHLVVSFSASEPEQSLPSLLGWFDLVYFVAAIRHATGVDVTPAAIEVEHARPDWTGAAEFFGCPVLVGSGYRLVLSHEDAARALITRNDALWEQLEKGLNDGFATALPERSFAGRVRQALVEGLPGGQVTADQIARALAVSKRSLQRRLSEEGVSYKDILEDTRRALALNYLQNSDMSVQEITFLLGFRDPRSFFRAFRSWTGKTPISVRSVRH